ncbi:hypothetical protein B296_00024238 [Ensete ventricosum]|uniref:Uncharacterized protein n=1 Tax=Ensete ventricosum TaxID=4639 RepID=A0A427A7I6_ENSVE|nr:hypothetical protein B296_00024238 [Ensete ventricosum]
MATYPTCHPSSLVVSRGVLGAIMLESASTHLACSPPASRRLCIGVPAVAFWRTQTKGCRSLDWFGSDHKSGFATEQVQQSGSLHKLSQPDVVALPFRVEFLDSGPRLVGEAEKGLSRDDKWCGVGHRWWEPQVDHHSPEMIWGQPRHGDLFRLLRVVRLYAMLCIRVTKRASFYSECYKSFVPEIFTASISYHVVILLHTIGGPCSEARVLLAAAVACRPYPLYPCQVDRMIVDSSMPVSGWLRCVGSITLAI